MQNVVVTAVFTAGTIKHPQGLARLGGGGGRFGTDAIRSRGVSILGVVKHSIDRSQRKMGRFMTFARMPLFFCSLVAIHCSDSIKFCCACSPEQLKRDIYFEKKQTIKISCVSLVCFQSNVESDCTYLLRLPLFPAARTCPTTAFFISNPLVLSAIASTTIRTARIERPALQKGLRILQRHMDALTNEVGHCFVCLLKIGAVCGQKDCWPMLKEQSSLGI